MDRRMFLLLFVVVFNLVGAGMDLYAASSNAKNTKKEEEVKVILDEKYEALKLLLFGPVTKIIAAVGVVYGIAAAFVGSSVKPLVVFIGIGLMASFGTKIIEILFGG